MVILLRCYTSAFNEVIYADFYAKILDLSFRLVDENNQILVVVFVSNLNFSFSFRFVDENCRIFVVIVVFVTKINLFSSTKIFVFVVVKEKTLMHSLPGGANPHTKPSWSPSVHCYCPQPPSPFFVTSLKMWCSFYHPTEDRRLSWQQSKCVRKRERKRKRKRRTRASYIVLMAYSDFRLTEFKNNIHLQHRDTGNCVSRQAQHPSPASTTQTRFTSAHKRHFTTITATTSVEIRYTRCARRQHRTSSFSFSQVTTTTFHWRLVSVSSHLSTQSTVGG